MSDDHPSRVRDFIPRLEAFRGLGALAIAAVHSAQARSAEDFSLLKASPTDSPFDSILKLLFSSLVNGHAALIFFFVMSGFVLSLSISRGPTAVAPASSRFFVGRFFRLFPAIAAAILIFVLVFWLTGGAIPGVPASSYEPVNILKNVFLLKWDIDGVMWSLQLEAFALPFIFVAAVTLRRFGAAPVVFLTAVLILLSFIGGWQKRLQPPLLDAGLIYTFVYGVAVHALGRQVVSRFSRPTLETLFVLLLMVFLFGRSLLGVTSRWTPLFETITAGGMIAAIAFRPELSAARLLDARFARFYGKISYSFYLLHPLSLIVLWDIEDTVSSLLRTGLPPTVIALAFFAVSTAVITPLAWLTWRFVELPGIALGRRLLKGPVPEPLLERHPPP